MPEPLLIVFARYPIPGKVKTRLARTIGAQAACRLYRACTERALQQARKWAKGCGGRVRICTAEPPDARWRRWLGEGWNLKAQREGDLGERMAAALHDGLSEGYGAAICIGTDAPALTAGHLREACRALRRSDAVVGPAADGGYYLIGLKTPAPALFEGIAWSTGSVLAQTRAAALRARLSLTEIRPLSDLDTAPDLWGGAGPVSIIIPALNEEAGIVACVARAIMLGPSEVIVADGGSRDGTQELARRSGARVIASLPGRGVQLNAGADAASGETLWFVHADCRLGPLALWEMGRALLDPAVAGGAFELRIDPAPGWLKVLEVTANMRSRLLGTPYGDQAMFVRRAAFEKIGGFPDWPLMEDIEMARRIRGAGKLVIVPAPATASARRWARGGVARTYVTMAMVKLGYRLGEPPEVLARLYDRGRHRR